MNAPLFYVHGNHDATSPAGPKPGVDLNEGLQTLEWGANLHRRVIRHEGLIVAGLEGCRRYKPAAPFQYGEREVRWQVFSLMQRLRLNRLRYGRQLDILVTHAPPRGIHDAEDLPHQGFAPYLKLLRASRPALMIHGHTHIYNRNNVTETDLGATRIINTYGYRVLELTPQWDTGGWELVRSS